MAEKKENPPAGGEVAQREEEILAYWNKYDTFEKSEEKDAPEGEFVFYDGPPFATGLPHYGHILAGTIKDAIPRYKTMRGFRVRRRWGWDCHGLPLENEIEKELNLKTKRDIEELGIGKFNEAARKAVLRYADDWKRIVPRMGRWVDMERDYRTMDAKYTESVWWSFKTLHKKGLVYEGFKSMHLCPRCGTTLSNFEVNLGYADIKDVAVTVKLPLTDEENTSLLAWTTTAWTLPGNMAAAVNKDATYIQAKVGDEYLIVAKDRSGILGDGAKIEEEFKGEKLLGKSYVPPFGYYRKAAIEGKENAWKIYHAPYVSLEEGTGIVHLAPAFGEEDMELAQASGIPIVHHVTREGTFTPEVKDFAGKSVKPKGNHQSADKLIAEHLSKKGLLFAQEEVTHSYPLCWRCDTPLLNYGASSWFVKVSKLKDKLVAENKKILWVPKEIGENRFGNWLLGARDWAVSRSRYWGAPLPVWKNKNKESYVVLGSVDELKQHTKKSGNRYLLMRHGEAESNEKGILNADLSVRNPLTDKGKSDVKEAASKLTHKSVDLVFYSPLERTKETADLVAKELNLKKEQLTQDERLLEVTFGEFEGKTIETYHSFFTYARERLTKPPKGGETWNQVKRRVSEFLYEIEKKYQNKTILVVSHNGSLQMLQAGAQSLDIARCADHISSGTFNVKNAEIIELPFSPLPHNNEYELDLHRPYIDEVELVDKDENVLERVPDVFDCWYESGSMPYGQYHYPFENETIFDPTQGLFKRARGYPADFIAEGLDQTRGWFYSLIVLGTALFNKAPYKNVIVNGLVLAKDGRKMSKRLKNYPEPLEVVNNYGADALRYYLLSSPLLRGGDLNFSEIGVAEVMRKVVVRADNVLSFYKLYRKTEKIIAGAPSTNVLDRWILARLAELVTEVTGGMEHYELDRATRPITDFVDDLSTWYLRRSRNRFKGEDGGDREEALATTRTVLETFSRVLAPFMPFFAEYLYREVTGAPEGESVHLQSWPQAKISDKAILADMQTLRRLVTLSLELRQEAGIKVRQPLGELVVREATLEGKEELLVLLRDEINVKKIKFNKSLPEEVTLETKITPELAIEGSMRELLRAIQELRKKKDLQPTDKIILEVHTDASGKNLLEQFKKKISYAALLEEIVFSEAAEGEEVVVRDMTFHLKIRA